MVHGLVKLAKTEGNQQNKEGRSNMSLKITDFEKAKTLTFYLKGENPRRIDNDT